MIREPIYAALFAFFAGLTDGVSPLFKTATRKPSVWEKLPPEDQPALLMRQRRERAEQARRLLPLNWILEVDLLLYAHTGAQSDPDIVEAQVINPLLDAIEAALLIDDVINQACTLGGLVANASIDGDIQVHLGGLGDEAVAVVPLRIVVNK